MNNVINNIYTELKDELGMCDFCTESLCKEVIRCPVCRVGRIAETWNYGIRLQCVDDQQGWNDTRTVKDYCGMSYPDLYTVRRDSNARTDQDSMECHEVTSEDRNMPKFF